MDSEVSAQALTIGSAADQQLQLLGRAVLPAHAVIRGEAASISARGRAALTVNGQRTRTQRLSPGDVIEIGRHRITVTPPPPGFDLALTVEPDTQTAKGEYESAFRTQLDQTWLSKRRFTWALLILTPLLIFLIPFATTLAHRAGTELPSFLPDDQMWTAGPLIPAHEQAAARRCEACHKSFFSLVQDGQCRECHKSVVDHVTPQHLAQTQLGPAARCGECHQEHNAPGGSLVARSNTLCVDCHARPDPAFGGLKVAAVSGFSPSGHPAFKATVLRPKVIPAAQLADLSQRDAPAEGTEALLWEQVAVPVAGGLESSNLKFSHAEHLDKDRVLRPADSRALECGDCHQLTTDGTQFKPVTMAAACRSCHELTFDPRNPRRQLAHGKPRDAILLIQDYYAHKYLDPGAVPDEAPRQPRRRMPDEAASEQENCQTGTPTQRGQCRAELEVMTQFTRRGCVSCHAVGDAGRGIALQDRFTVRPVRVVADYLPGVHFSHRAHAVQKNLTGQAACLSCHAAGTSTETTRLMIPDRGKCLECHGETPARDRVQLQCVSCHAYHADHSDRPSSQT
jgi:predicted CXXCH cytochrome family protein